MISQRLLALFFASGLFRLWQEVPRPLRRRIVRAMLPLRRGPRLTHPQAPLLICGFLSSVVGLGWSARGFLRTAEAAGLDMIPIDISNGFRATDLPGADIAPPQDLSFPGTLLLNCNPHQFAYVLHLVPPAVVEWKYVIAHCTWELERVPADWLPALDIVDEVWVPSRFVRDAFIDSGCTKPIQILPYLLDPTTSVTADRSRFSLSEDRFIVMSSLSVNSGFARKNPQACIESFRRAFGPNDPAALIIKVSAGTLDAKQRNELVALSGGDPRISFNEDLFSDTDTCRFLSCCDAILSLHRSEGFGLTPAQGMLLGKAVIATDWSGNTDYMNAENSELIPYRLVPVNDQDQIYDLPGARWAEPDVDAAAAALRRCFGSESHRAQLGERARADAAAFFGRASANALAIFRSWVQRGSTA